MARWLPLLASLVLLLGCGASPATLQVTDASVSFSRSHQVDLNSKLNGRSYRIFIATPPNMAPGTRYPVLYVLDGNQYFGTASEAVWRQSTFGVIKPVIVVGIGYPTDDMVKISEERAFDLTPSESRSPNFSGRFGGGSAFAQVLNEEIKPLVQQRFPVDVGRQALWGHSYGGLSAMGLLFRQPASFQAYGFSSPSIWWNGREVLNDEGGLPARLAALDKPVRVLIASAADEQYRGPDAQLAAMYRGRMVDNASDLAKRLAPLNPDKLKVQRVIFDDEVHLTVSPASISRMLRFAFSEP